MASTLYSLYFSGSYSRPLSLQSRRLSVPLSFKSPSCPLSFKNTHRFIKNAISDQYHEKDERNEISGAPGEKENQGTMPKHVAIILDGNRRWATKKGLTITEGHEAGGRRALEMTMDFFSVGINTVSLFAFSTENWRRPEDEVNYLMDIFKTFFKTEIPHAPRHKCKVSFIGNREKIPTSLRDVILEVEEATKKYEGKHLIMAIDYSGRFDILQACKSLAEKAKNGLIQTDDIDETLLENELMTKCSEFPNPDLLIRTSGEQRISNFFLWQSAYTELYFPTVQWPEFGKAEYLEALTWYQQRQRRFGRRV
ncbi:Dehydrodolichyl diphosphate synthase 5 [Raphanus sativus]|nr:Dehydrodolichyl diphosphate synthase 5 [Raphanus sativus]